MNMFGYTSLGTVGAPEDFNQQAWSDYVTTLRQSLRDAWKNTASAYNTLKSIREQFGLPFISDPVVSEGTLVGDPGAWTSDLQERILRLQQVAEVLDQIATDALQNKRQLGWDAQGQYVIEKLPGDNVTVQNVNGFPELVSDATGAVIGPSTGMEIKPAIGVGLPPVAVVAIVGIAAVGIYFSVEAVCSTIEKSAEEKTNQTLASEQKKLVESGKATPEQAAQMTSAVLKGRAEIKQAEAAAAAQKPTSQLASTARTLGFVALGVAGIYLASQVIGRTPVRSTSTALARNPRRPGRGETLEAKLDFLNEEIALLEEELKDEGRVRLTSPDVIRRSEKRRRQIEVELEKLYENHERVRRQLEASSY